MVKKNSLLRLTALLLMLAFVLLLPGCSKSNVITNPDDLPIDYDTSRLIKFEIELDDGDIVSGELYPLAAPITVRNFVTLVEDGYYNGKTFDRVIADKLVQCTGTGDKPYTIRGEFKDNGWKNTLSHLRGTLSMSHIGDQMDSAYGTFFVLLENRTYYDGEYAAFGRITDGLIHLDHTSRVEVENETSPVEPQTIKEIRILGN
ncbi:MAG: peptidylprolyl isomerase [Ruminococcaceae bacterium]|nr:peptidylprolyl isomerase [Oscillospiraceae bacterium]